MNPKLDWSKFHTAYGTAEEIPNLLKKLASSDLDLAMEASHLLWCCLCHQHAYITCAALPSYPVIFNTLQSSAEVVAVEILDILLGFATCSSPSQYTHETPPTWVTTLRAHMQKDRSQFARLSKSDNPEISEFASQIVEELSET